MPEVTLRMARQQDAAAMTVLQRASWLAAYGEVLGADLLDSLSPSVHLQLWRKRLGGHDPRPMLVCVQDVVVGLLYWQHQEGDIGPEAHSRALYLHPAHWRRGHGKRLWQAVAMQMRRAGYERVSLWLLAGNQVGQGFYLRRGFRFDGIERTLSQQGRPCLQQKMSRDL
jgi:GNAT superfamily N-acetyltransferase